MRISNIITDKVVAKIPYQGKPEFVVELAYLSRDELLKLRKEATTNVYDPSTRKMEEKVDQDIFLEQYAKKVILGWEGLTLKYLKDLLPIESSDSDDTEIGYDTENVVQLLKHSSAFDEWVTMVTASLESFRHSTKN